MLEVVHVSNENRHLTLSKTKPCVMALGFFDGVHLGHQQVIKEAKKIADKQKLPLMTMSFFPHPKEVLSNGKETVPYLMPLKDKEMVFRKLGINTFYMVQFDPALAALSPTQFVKDYLLDFDAKQVVAGFDFTYGSGGSGNIDRIKVDSEGKIEGVKVKKVEFQGEKISSTLIRNKILSGEVEKIPHYLGDYYQIEGRVSKVAPHIEISMGPYYLLPASGMYDVTISNDHESFSQKIVVNDDKIKFVSEHRNIFPIRKSDHIRIQWNKRLPDEWSTFYHEALYKVNVF